MALSTRKLAQVMGMSATRARQLVAQGMPSTVAEAEEWRAARKITVCVDQSRRGRIAVDQTKKREAREKPKAPDKPPISAKPSEVSDKGPRGSIARLRLAEVKQYDLWVEIIKQRGTVAEVDRALRSYTHAAEQRMGAEMHLDSWRENRGELIRAQAAIKLFRDSVQELLPAMRNAPDRYASRVNPDNPDTGRRGLEALRAELGEVVRRAVATLSERLGPEARVDE